jgi:hypothetical protein
MTNGVITAVVATMTPVLVPAGSSAHAWGTDRELRLWAQTDAPDGSGRTRADASGHRPGTGLKWNTRFKTDLSTCDRRCTDTGRR